MGMSDVDIVLRNAVRDVMEPGKEASIAAVREALRRDPLFADRSAPAEWITSVLKDEERRALFEAHSCEQCGTQGVCEDGMDIFGASLCRGCFEKLWRKYNEAVESDTP